MGNFIMDEFDSKYLNSSVSLYIIRSEITRCYCHLMQWFWKCTIPYLWHACSIKTKLQQIKPIDISASLQKIYEIERYVKPQFNDAIGWVHDTTNFTEKLLDFFKTHKQQKKNNNGDC